MSMLQINSCTNSTEPDGDVIFYTSFENVSDLDGWDGFGSESLYDDVAPNGGKKSVYISGGCIFPTSSLTLPPQGEGRFIQVQCYGKNLDSGGGVHAYVGDDANTEYSVGIDKPLWHLYKISGTIFWPADKSLTICLNSGGYVPSAMLIDELKILRIN